MLKRIFVALLLWLGFLAGAVAQPGWAYGGASVDCDFANSRYYNCPLLETILLTRASTGTDLLPASNSGASYNTFPSGVLRITPQVGLLIEESRTNQLLNSTAPVTQTTGLLPNGTYTLWVNGSGSAAMSSGTATGCGTSVATQGIPISFTTTGTVGTCIITVSGSLNAFQLELGAFGTSLIVTSVTTATRAADNIQFGTARMMGLTVGGIYTAMFGYYGVPTSATQDDILSNSVRDIFYVDGTGLAGRSAGNTLLSFTPCYLAGLTKIAMGGDFAGRTFICGGTGGSSDADANGNTGTLPLFLGSHTGSTDFLNRQISRITFWTNRIPTLQLQALSQLIDQSQPLSQPTITVQTSQPCDLVTCAEAYSVTRKMTTAYSGKLFQLYNGSSTLDIGLATNGVTTDMTTWSAFCSGVPSNCVYGKIYGQINSSVNDLIPSQFSGSGSRPDCTTSFYECAAPFQIDPATNLPIIMLVPGYEYTIASDAAATGITSGANPLSVLYNTQFVRSALCCGSFGMTHVWNAGDTEGTDFSLGITWGDANGFLCVNAVTFCPGIDEEEAGNTSAYGTAIINAVAAATYNGSNNVTINVNNHQLVSATPMAPSLVPGTSIHLGGGGDLTQPASMGFREAIITNSQLTATQIGTIFTNNALTYSGLVFP